MDISRPGIEHSTLSDLDFGPIAAAAGIHLERPISDTGRRVIGHSIPPADFQPRRKPGDEMARALQKFQHRLTAGVLDDD